MNLWILVALMMAIALPVMAASPADLSGGAEHLNQARAELGVDAAQNMTLEDIIPGQISQNINESKAQLKRAAARQIEQRFNDTTEQLHQEINNTAEHLKREAQNEFRNQVEKRAQPGMGAAQGMGAALAVLGLLLVFRIIRRD